MKQKGLRIAGMVLLGLTAVFTLLGGVGTTCVAFAAEIYGEKMAPLIAVKPIFQILVFVSIAAAALGLWSTYGLSRGRKGAYQQALLFLGVGLIASAIQFYYSLTLRGSTAPNNIRMYLTGITLVVFLLFRLPGVWQKIGFEKSAGSGMGTPSGLAMILAGVLVLSTPLWAGSSHIVDGFNTVNVLFWPLMVSGAGLVVMGGLLLRGNLHRKMVEVVAEERY